MQEPVPAKFVVINGVMTGQVFPLSGGEITFGRDSTNDITVPDVALSRLHCAFTSGPDGWHVRDVGSSNGTFVNGVQIQSHHLVEGDRVAVGGSLLLYVLDEHTPTGSATLDDDVPPPPTTRLAPEDAAYLRLRADPDQRHQPTVDGLRALLAISTAIYAIRDEVALDRELLGLLFDVVPAAEGAIVQPGAADELIVQSVRPPSSDSPVHVNAALVRQVIGEGTGVLCGDAAVPKSEVPAARSLLVVPMTAHERPFGVIYLRARADAAFTDNHLQLVTAVGRIAAIAIDNNRRFVALERETDRLQADLHLKHQMIGESELVRQVYARIAKVARVDTTVLLTGETGTGKEMAASAIHFNSARARRPFVAINCAALSESLLESELFGHERGAFTNAFALKKGKLELADGGTVFLDEIGELMPALQSKLLRVLQERELERVGGTQRIKVDLRIVSATNRDLVAGVASGTFRQDLYFRLNVVQIHLPPLRDRREDIPSLARHFLSVYARKAGRRVDTISPAAMECLRAYDWPGNVRELENALERACVLGNSHEIELEDLPDTVLERGPIGMSDPVTALQARVLDAKRRAVFEAFRRAGGSYTETAKILKVHPNYLHRLIRNLDIKGMLEGSEA